MLENYLTMMAIYKSKTGENDYNEPIFNEKEIKCRLVEKFKQVTNEKGNIVVTSSVIQCIEPIKVGDYINNMKVIAANSMTSLEGTIGYRGYLL
ncbi:MAG TPA: hypothetical protein DDY58_17285 [Terrisporobacter glycolicus]|uniref:hypothetical protein n=1 Tax=Terrisporobacter TaxID=1505652 RepID=UPI000E9D5170|nr:MULTISPECIES: hypothetical protein [Terrisporobacter]HBI94027.1 hypothetical protein [Terrisporobacter hibernicus]